MIWYLAPPAGEYFSTYPVVDPSGNVYVISDRNTVYSISRSGTFNWDHPTGLISSTSRATPALGKDGILYATKDNVLYALATSDGGLLWYLKFPEFYLSSTPIVGNDGTVYIAHTAPTSSSLYAVSTQGSILWKVGTRTVAPFGHPVIASDGKLYVYNSIGQYFVFS